MSETTGAWTLAIACLVCLSACRRDPKDPLATEHAASSQGDAGMVILRDGIRGNPIAVHDKWIYTTRIEGSRYMLDRSSATGQRETIAQYEARCDLDTNPTVEWAQAESSWALVELCGRETSVHTAGGVEVIPQIQPPGVAFLRCASDRSRLLCITYWFTRNARAFRLDGVKCIRREEQKGLACESVQWNSPPFPVLREGSWVGITPEAPTPMTDGGLLADGGELRIIDISPKVSNNEMDILGLIGRPIADRDRSFHDCDSYARQHGVFAGSGQLVNLELGCDGQAQSWLAGPDRFGLVTLVTLEETTFSREYGVGRFFGFSTRDDDLEARRDVGPSGLFDRLLSVDDWNSNGTAAIVVVLVDERPITGVLEPFEDPPRMTTLCAGDRHTVEVTWLKSADELLFLECEGERSLVQLAGRNSTVSP